MSADIELDPAIIATLADDAPVETVRRGIVPGNFANPNPNLVLQRPNGMRIGMSDDRSPWSAALAQSPGCGTGVAKPLIFRNNRVVRSTDGAAP